MYPKPHLKIKGRSHSYNPKEGILIALDTLVDPESHYDDYMISACYLCYRCLDKTYENTEMAWRHLCKAKEIIDGLSIGSNFSWYVARWQSSIRIAEIYMRACCLNKRIPVFDIYQLATSNYCIVYPPQMVNILRANSLLMLTKYLQRKNEFCEEHIYTYAVPLFQKSVMLYKIPKDYDLGLTMMAEIREAVDCIGFIMEMRNLFNSSDPEKINKLKLLINNGIKSVGSMKIYYQTLEVILNQNIQDYESGNKEIK